MMGDSNRNLGSNADNGAELQTNKEHSDNNQSSSNSRIPPPPPPPNGPKKQSSTRFDYSIFGDSRKAALLVDPETAHPEATAEDTGDGRASWGAGEDTVYYDSKGGRIGKQAL